jgi:uncharacterized membrane protein YtjA (UPF0391 family)
MFSGAVLSLIVAVIAALFGYGGMRDATVAVIAQHTFLIAIGLFAISAAGAILDIELPSARLVRPKRDRNAITTH